MILSPKQALGYLDEIMARGRKISVVGIAGPGDPFANAQETMDTLFFVRRKYPDILLCVATNGLNVLPYLDALSEIRVSHVSVTINAVDPEIGAEIYSWARDNKKVYHGMEAAELLLERQAEAVKGLKERNIIIKINSIIIPGINDGHIKEIARKVSQWGADIMNPIPLYAVEDSVFGNLGEPSEESVIQVRKDAQDFLPIMNHCSRCRADAVGLLDEKPDNAGFALLKSFAGLALNPQENRPFVAVASREGMLVNLHLGEAEKLYVYKQKGDEYLLVDVRSTPPPGGGNRRWEDLAKQLSDCQAILVAKVGRFPSELLNKAGIKVIEMQGLIEEGLELVFNGQEVPFALKPEPCTSSCAHTAQGESCRCSGGSGMGCG